MTLQPNDYSIRLPQQAMSGALAGVQNALQIAHGMDAAEAEKARGELLRAQTANAEAELAARQRASEQAAVLQQDVNAVLGRPTAEGINALMIKYPHLSEGFQRGLSALNAEAREARIREGTQVYAAILNGRPEMGAQILTDTAAALREKGNVPQAEGYERMAKLIELNPEGAQTTVGMMLSSAMGPERFQQTFKELEDQRRSRMTEKDVARKAGADADKAVSDAAIAAAKARYAESLAAMEVKEKGFSIEKLQAEASLARANTNLATMRARLEKELAPLQRQELQAKIENAERERDKRTREVAAEATGQYQIVNEARSLIKDILSDENRPALKGATGMTAIIGAIPGTPERGIANKIERLGSLLTVDNLKLMSGVLTNTDLMVLQQVSGNFDRYMKTGTVIAELQRVNSTLDTAEAKLDMRYGGAPKAPNPDNSESDWAKR